MEDKESMFWFISLLRSNLSLILFLIIILFPATNINFKITVVIWVAMMITTFFNFSKRLEKNILREVSWDGVYEILPYLKIEKTEKNIKKISYYFSLTTFYIILYKFYL